MNDKEFAAFKGIIFGMALACFLYAFFTWL